MYILQRIILLMSVFSVSANAGDDYFFEKIHSQNAKYIELAGLNHRIWTNNTVEWWYNPHNQPFSTDSVVQAITNATLAWQTISGVQFVYRGVTNQNLSATLDDKLVIGWLDEQTFISRFGNYSGYTYIWWTRNIIDAEVSLNLGSKAMTSSIDNVQGIITHELGHVLGLDHSGDPASIMFANPYHPYDYQMILRTDDVGAARALYPCEGCGDWQRILNWAETAYSSLFNATHKQTVFFTPYDARFYPETNTYLGYNTDDEHFYGYNVSFWGTQLVMFGSLSDYLNSAVQAGF